MTASANTALVIEDLRDQAELWSVICAHVGLTSATAVTGADGYRLACELRPQIILLDLILPDCDGWDVCRLLKADDRTKDIPVVILTGRDEPHAEHRALQAGCAAYLRKPCAPTELVTVLQGIRRQTQESAPAAVSAAPQIFDAIDRLKAVFAEIPGTQLSIDEASRMSGLEPARCRPVLEGLVTTGFLRRGRGRDSRFRLAS